MSINLSHNKISKWIDLLQSETKTRWWWISNLIKYGSFALWLNLIACNPPEVVKSWWDKPIDKIISFSYEKWKDSWRFVEVMANTPDNPNDIEIGDTLALEKIANTWEIAPWVQVASRTKQILPEWTPVDFTGLVIPDQIMKSLVGWKKFNATYTLFDFIKTPEFLSLYNNFIKPFLIKKNLEYFNDPNNAWKLPQLSNVSINLPLSYWWEVIYEWWWSATAMEMADGNYVTIWFSGDAWASNLILKDPERIVTPKQRNLITHFFTLWHEDWHFWNWFKDFGGELWSKDVRETTDDQWTKIDKFWHPKRSFWWPQNILAPSWSHNLREDSPTTWLFPEWWSISYILQNWKIIQRVDPTNSNYSYLETMTPRMKEFALQRLIKTYTWSTNSTEIGRLKADALKLSSSSWWRLSSDSDNYFEAYELWRLASNPKKEISKILMCDR